MNSSSSSSTSSSALSEHEQESLKKFKEFDWTDSRWQTYLANIYPVPAASKLDKSKKRFYQQHVDSSFKMEWDVSGTRPEERRRAGGSASNPQATFPSRNSGVGRVSSPGLLKLPATVSLLSGFCLSILYTLPLPTSATARFYICAWLAFFFGLLLDLGAKHGRPKLSWEWWQPVFIDDDGQMLLYMLFTATNTRNPLTFIPLAITAALQGAETFVVYKQSLPAIVTRSESLQKAAKKLHSQRIWWMQLRADVEVGLGALLVILALMTGGTGLLSVFLYFHFLKLRYTMSGFTNTTFSKIDGKLTRLCGSPYCPKVFGFVYNKMRALCRSLADPAGGAAGRPGGGGGGRLCSIQ